jgi:hypothetical protein
MYKKQLLMLLLAFSFSACKNNENDSACGTQICTAVYAYIGVTFTDNIGKIIVLDDVKMVNLRTGKELVSPRYPPNIDFIAGFNLIASDDTKKDFSTNGDDIEITATYAATGQTKKFKMKISGGCNCHINKISGPETVRFD